jgi:hypothetical protein
MLDLTTNSLPDIASKTTSYPITQTLKCESKISSVSPTPTKASLNNSKSPKDNQHQKGSIEPVSDTYLYPPQSLISPALFARSLSFAQLPTSSPSRDKTSQTFTSLRNKMNEDILQSTLASSKVLGMSLPTSKALPSSSAPSSLKLLPKKFSPFSVDSLLSHKEKQAACEDSIGDNEGSTNSMDLKSFEIKKQSKVQDDVPTDPSALAPILSQDLRSLNLSQDPIGISHHLSVAKFLLNNNLHDRSSSDSINRLHSLKAENEDSTSKEKFKNEILKRCHNRDSSELKRCLDKNETNHINTEYGSSNENDIDVCGDEADMNDEDVDYPEDINDIKSEGNYQNMLSDEDVSGEEDNEHNDFVKTEDIEDEKRELERQLARFSGSDHHLSSRSNMSPHQRPILSPRFPLGFPITSASPNPFTPTSPSAGIEGSTLPRPTPSLPWLPQLRSPMPGLQMPGFMGSKYFMHS